MQNPSIGVNLMLHPIPPNQIGAFLQEVQERKVVRYMYSVSILVF